ncbi:phosphotransferase family protein [Streptomyces sp. NPDC059982]|uniref:phosphotransferase family protein n=1 Tax=Streptomyces sp. NPDC059982 TaxID=3347024 RepID=UPI0036CCB0D2
MSALPLPAPLPAALASWARGGGPGRPYELLADRPDGTVVRCGDAVAKAHAPGSDPEALAARIRLAGSGALAGVLLPPLRTGAVHGRAVSLWPYGAPVDPERPQEAPWEEAARLLAALHRIPPHALPGPVPPMRGPAKVARALRRLARAPQAGREAGRAVRAAAGTLPAWARGEADPPPGAAALCHGDLHLGQLVRHPAPDGPWRLIDVDDLGLGAPAWDLGRPAAWYAAGILAPDAWSRFLDAYRAAGGPAAGPPGTDPWLELDLAARALTVQTAALAVAKAAPARRPLDEAERLMLDSCVRMATFRAELEP